MTDLSTTRSLVAAAASTVEDDVAKPIRRQAGSFASSVFDLSVGDTASRAVKIDPLHTLQEYAEYGVNIRDSLRNNSMTAVRRAKVQTGGEYVTEVSEIMTQSRNLFVVVLVTRVA